MSTNDNQSQHVSEEEKREMIRKCLYDLLIGIVDSEKDRQFVLSYLDGVLDSLLPEKVDYQAVSEYEPEILIFPNGATDEMIEKARMMFSPPKPISKEEMKYNYREYRRGNLKLNNEEQYIMNVLKEFGESVDPEGYGGGDYNMAMMKLLSILSKKEEECRRYRKVLEKIIDANIAPSFASQNEIEEVTEYAKSIAEEALSQSKP